MVFVDHGQKPGKEHGTFQAACKKAAKFANHRGGMLEAAELFLERAGWLHATFGVESISIKGYNLQYLNTGETYNDTVCWENGKCFVGSWGSWAESIEEEICEQEGQIRCGWCGEFTKHPNDVEWNEVVCEYCGNNVSG